LLQIRTDSELILDDSGKPVADSVSNSQACSTLLTSLVEVSPMKKKSKFFDDARTSPHFKMLVFRCNMGYKGLHS